MIAGWRKLLDQVDELLELEAGWDSYGADPITAAAADLCRRLIRMLSALDVDAAEPMPIPSLCPTCAGGLQLQWHDGEFDVEVTVTAAGEIEGWCGPVSSTPGTGPTTAATTPR